MLRATVTTLTALLALLPILACAAGPETADTATETTTADSEIVARIGDEVITDAELEESISANLMQLKQQIYTAKRQALERQLFDRLVEREAEAQGVSKEEYVASRLEGGLDPSEEEIQKVLKQYRPQLPPDEEQARERVVMYLRQQAANEARSELQDELFRKHDAQILLEPPKVDYQVHDYNPARGAEDPVVTLVEYTDFQCPYCTRAQETLDQVMERYGSVVQHVFKHLPLAMHQQAAFAAEASLCASDQGKFWELHDWLFANASRISEDTVLAQVEELGMDRAAFETCLKEDVHTAHVEQDTQEANAAGIRGTPGFVVNGRVITGAQPYEAFASVINEELRRAGVEIPEPVEQQATVQGEEAAPTE